MKDKPTQEPSQHAKWANTDANRRTKATQQMFRYLTGAIPRVPETAAETYKALVDQRTKYSDLNQCLGEKVDDTRESIEELRSGCNALSKTCIDVGCFCQE